MPARFIVEKDKVTLIHGPEHPDQFNFSYWFHLIVPDKSEHKKGFGAVEGGIKWEFGIKYFEDVIATARKYYEKVAVEDRRFAREVTKEQLGLF
jgi:hypothetical protein